ncbi:MAG: protein-(glutamine-N5) methyltransferase, release factor-specific, partial [Planctomycetaceae bacterium]|nr:protein-(glutamine-N5) methyltransferase, release factor-specific [Planctomycetaceae bacterium]
MPTVAELLGSASGLSAGSGRRDVEILLCHCLGKSRAWLYTWPEEEVEASKVGHFESL